MSIPARKRLTLISGLVMGLALTIAVPVVYVIFTSSTNKLIFNKLEEMCWISGIFYLEEDELSLTDHRKVERQFLEVISDAEVRIFDSLNTIAYGSKIPDPYITKEILDMVRTTGSHSFNKSNIYYYGIFYHDNQGDFVVFIKEQNLLVANQRDNLLLILLSVLVVGLSIVLVLSRVFASIAYQPIKRLSTQMHAINPDTLGERLTNPESNDEVQELIDAFNKLLQRLDDVFGYQRNFVNYVAHEFKTPLTAIAGHLELLTSKHRPVEEYRQTITEVMDDVHRLEDVISTFQMLAGDATHMHNTSKLRIDELLWKIIEKVGMAYPELTINFHTAIQAKRQHLLEIEATETQLEIAVYNLVENASKFGLGEPVYISLKEEKNRLQIDITDTGIGIQPEDLKYITEPFFRGNNVQHISGKGLGLALSKRILDMNGVHMEIVSSPGKGTTVRLSFNHKQS